MIKRANKACGFFPCHKGLEDCTFCYCPFYPCLNDSRGSFVYSAKSEKGIWSCQDCNWIHKRKVVDGFFSLIRRNRPQPQSGPGRLSGGVKTGIIILGHGSKLHKANKLIPEIIKIIKRRTGYSIIEPSSLQFHHPDLSGSIKKVIQKGCKKIIIVPFFLFEGNHVKRDIPQAVKKAIDKYPGVRFVFTKSLGEDATISDIVFRNINEAMAV